MATQARVVSRAQPGRRGAGGRGNPTDDDSADHELIEDYCLGNLMGSEELGRRRRARRNRRCSLIKDRTARRWMELGRRSAEWSQQILTTEIDNGMYCTYPTYVRDHELAVDTGGGWRRSHECGRVQ